MVNQQDDLTPEEHLRRLIGLAPGMMESNAPPRVEGPNALSSTPSAPAAPSVAPGPIATPAASGAVPVIPKPQKSAEQQRAETELGRLQTTGSGVEQLQHHHPILGTIARIGDVALQSLFPRVAMNIPGTTAHHQTLEATEEAKIGQGVEEQQKEAAAQKDVADATKDLNPAAKQGLTPEETTIHDLMTGLNGTPRINPQTGKPYTYLEAFTAVKQANQDVKPEKTQPAHVTYDQGIPVSVTDAKGSTYDINDPKLPPELKPLVDAANRAHGQHVTEEVNKEQRAADRAGDKKSGAESAQVEREARQSIRKASEKYRDTQQSVAQLKTAIDSASDGNGLLTSFVPTMEVLGINAANGVHRISPAEAEAAQLPGGWSERFNAWFDKATTGKVSPQLKEEGKKLAELLGKTAYQRYKSVYDDESGIAGGYGIKDFGRRVPLIQEEKEQQQQGGATTTFKVGARVFDIPADKVQAFKTKYPNAVQQ